MQTESKSREQRGKEGTLSCNGLGGGVLGLLTPKPTTYRGYKNLDRAGRSYEE